MRRIALGVVAVLAAVLPLGFLPRPAVACVCAGTTHPNIEFEGEAVGGTDTTDSGWPWKFRVIAGNGVANGELIEVVLDVERPSPNGDGWISSSCGVGDAPTPGQRYYVGASRYEERYYAAQCGGYLRDASSAPPTIVVNESDARDDVGPPLVAAASATLAAAGVLVLRALRP